MSDDHASRARNVGRGHDRRRFLMGGASAAAAPVIARTLTADAAPGALAGADRPRSSEFCAESQRS